jgi:hypothetical protein
MSVTPSIALITSDDDDGVGCPRWGKAGRPQNPMDRRDMCRATAREQKNPALRLTAVTASHPALVNANARLADRGAGVPDEDVDAAGPPGEDATDIGFAGHVHRLRFGIPELAPQPRSFLEITVDYDGVRPTGDKGFRRCAPTAAGAALDDRNLSIDVKTVEHARHAVLHPHQ